MLTKSCTLPRFLHTSRETRLTMIATTYCQYYKSYMRADTSTLKKIGLIESNEKTATSILQPTQPTSNSTIKNIQPSLNLSTAKTQVIALVIKRRLPNQRPLQQCGPNQDGPTKRCGRIKGAKQEQPRRV